MIIMDPFLPISLVPIALALPRKHSKKSAIGTSDIGRIGSLGLLI